MQIARKLSRLAEAALILVLLSAPAFADVESTLAAFQSKLINTILPMVGILGVVWAGLSFVLGKENARSHLLLALLGVAVGFGAPSLISLIRSLVN